MVTTGVFGGLIWKDLLFKRMDLVDEGCLVDLIWKDGSGKICRMTFSFMSRDLKG